MVESLERVIEVFVPIIDAHASRHAAKIKCDDRNQKTPGGPFLFTCPIGFGDPPGRPRLYFALVLRIRLRSYPLVWPRKFALIAFPLIFVNQVWRPPLADSRTIPARQVFTNLHNCEHITHVAVGVFAMHPHHRLTASLDLPTHLPLTTPNGAIPGKRTTIERQDIGSSSFQPDARRLLPKSIRFS